MTLIKDFAGWKWPEYVWLLFATLFIATISFILHDTWLDQVTAIANVLCVILVAKGKISNYFWGAIGVTLYGYAAFTQHYYGNMMLNWLYFLPLQGIGYYLWRQHFNNHAATVTKAYLNWSTRLMLAVGLGIAMYIVGLYLKSKADPMPFLDAFTTLASILAMLLMVKRFAEQWVLWVAVNAVSIYMWAIPALGQDKGAAVMAMWCVYLINALYGLYMWFRKPD